MAQHLRSEYWGKASGGKLYSFLNAMQSAGVCCRGQRCLGNVYQFRIYATAHAEVESLATEYGVTLVLTPRRTLQAFLHRYRFRFGIPIGVLLATGLLFYGSNIVLQVDIIGNDEATNPEILAVLEERGVTRGTWIPSIDFAGCEHELRADVEELAWVGMRHTGNRLVVEVMERTPEPEMLEERVPSNVVASRDGQIVSFTIFSGQVMKLVGEPVRKGDLLVSGVVTDETGHLGIRHAMGSVIGLYQQEEVFTCPYEQQLRRYTGENTVQQYLDLFAWHIPLGNVENPYPDSIETTEYAWFSLLGRELPIGIYRETYQEYRTHTLYFTPEEAEANLTEQVQRYEDNFLTEMEITDKKITALETEDGLTWKVTYTLQGEIGMQQELYLQDG